MFSVEKFKNIIHEQLLSPLLIKSWGYDPSYSTDIKDFRYLFWHPYCTGEAGRQAGRCILWYEEPLNSIDLHKLQYYNIYIPELLIYVAAEYHTSPDTPYMPSCRSGMYDCNIHIFANSEISPLKKQFLKEYPLYDWYFFFHGFAALDWFRNYKYLTFKHCAINKVFICLNHLINNNRSYRLNLLSNLREKKLEQFGYVSAPLLTKDVIKKEITDPNSRLSVKTKKHILNHLMPTAQPVILDSNSNYNNASAEISDFHHNALWNVVTETNFYDDKLHLTEKIFKPIATRRPFILVSSPGNLAYLKRYGFKTFDKYIDESYDDEQDDDRRIALIVKQLQNLCKMSSEELSNMYNDMTDILEFNHQHFYGKFKEIIVNELVDNFEGCLKKYNLHLSDWRQVPAHQVNFDNVKKLLLE